MSGGRKTRVQNGSVIHVYPNQFMFLVDGGKSSISRRRRAITPSRNPRCLAVFGVRGSAQGVLQRVKFGGVSTPTAQKCTTSTCRKSKGIKFGTRTPINYFDAIFTIPNCCLRAHGLIPSKSPTRSSFMRRRSLARATASRSGTSMSSISPNSRGAPVGNHQLSADGVRISYVVSKAGN
jgi:membrane protease subunit (stomatin/prohibitin family)